MPDDRCPDKKSSSWKAVFLDVKSAVCGPSAECIKTLRQDQKFPKAMLDREHREHIISLHIACQETRVHLLCCVAFAVGT